MKTSTPILRRGPLDTTVITQLDPFDGYCPSCGLKLPTKSKNKFKNCPNCSIALRKITPKSRVGMPYLSTPEVDASFNTAR